MSSLKTSGVVKEDGNIREWRLAWPLFSAAADWIDKAEKGAEVEYYVGDLALDRAFGMGSALPVSSAMMLGSIADVMMAAQEAGLVLLVQKRGEKGNRHYLARRTGRDADSFVAEVRERAAPVRSAA